MADTLKTDQAALFESIMAGKYEYDEEYWADISDQAKDMIDRLLTLDQNLRITAKEALEHPWITGAKEEGRRAVTNLVPNVRKGFNSRQSLRSVVTAMTLLNHWKNLEDLSEDEDDTETSNEKKE